MEKYVKYFGRFILIVLTLTIGIYLGGLLEEYKNNQMNGNLYDSTKIAIVNLDAGIPYQNEQKNFAKELLENYSEDFTVTGLDDAKRGLTDGRYAAYVILPSDFSSNVVSVNATPKKSLLKYEVSGDLSQEATDKAWQSVMKLKEHLNNDVGYMYISSILNEFHSGQDSALKVLKNDSQDKEVIMAISNLDLIATLDITEVERLQNNIADLDVNPDFETNKAIIASIDSAYKRYLGETASELKSLQDEKDNINGKIENINQTAGELQNIFNEDGTANYFLTDTGTEIEKFNASLEGNIDNIGKAISEAIESSNEGEKVKNSASSELEALNENIGDSFKKVTDIYQNNFFKENDSDILEIYPTLKSSVETYDKEKTEFIVAQNNVTGKIMKGSNDYINNLSTGTNQNLRDYLIQEYSQDQVMKADLKKIAKFMNYGNVDNFSLENYLDLFYDTTQIISNGSTDTISLKVTIAEALHADLMENLNNASNTIEEEKLINNLNSSIESIVKMLGDIKGFDSDPIQNEVKNLQENSAPINMDNINSWVSHDLSSLNTTQKNQKQTLLSVIECHKNVMGEFLGRLGKYNPLESIKDDEIKAYVDDFDKNNIEMQKKIEDKNREYVSFVDESYKNADEQVRTLYEDVRKYQQESDEKITKGLESAKQKKDETSASNIALMNDYINKLPYTRNGTVNNSVVNDFIVSSSDMEGGKAKNSLIKDGMNFSAIFIGISCALVIAWVVTYIFSKRKDSKS